MNDSLKHRFTTGFWFQNRWFPWGTLFGELLELFPGRRAIDPRWLEAAASNLGTIEVIHSSISGPHTQRPVVMAIYALRQQVATDSGLAEFRATLDRVFGSGTHETVAPIPGFPRAGSVRASSDWFVGDTKISLSAYGAVRDQQFGKTSGGLFVYRDPATLAVPFLAELRGDGQPWMTGPGDVLTFAAPGSSISGLQTTLDEYELALRQPHLRLTPAWVKKHLGEGDVAVWDHPSGFWGIANPTTTIAIETSGGLHLEHQRCLPARGSGHAALEWSGYGAVVGSGPGPDGLASLISALRTRPGVVIETTEFTDA